MRLLENIQFLCKERDISIPRLEKELGLGNGAIYKWEKSSPSIDKLQKVAEYFNVSIDYLLGKTEIRNLDEAYKVLLDHKTSIVNNTDGSIIRTPELKSFPLNEQEVFIKLAETYLKNDKAQSEDSKFFSLKNTMEDEVMDIQNSIHSMKNPNDIDKKTMESVSKMMEIIIRSLENNTPIPQLSEDSEVKLIIRFRNLPPDYQKLVLEHLDSAERLAQKERAKNEQSSSSEEVG
jgi:Helix-turn-helix.